MGEGRGVRVRVEGNVLTCAGSEGGYDEQQKAITENAGKEIETQKGQKKARTSISSIMFDGSFQQKSKRHH
jgi:hypothetical protein